MVDLHLVPRSAINRILALEIGEKSQKSRDSRTGTPGTPARDRVVMQDAVVDPQIHHSTRLSRALDRPPGALSTPDLGAGPSTTYEARILRTK